MPVYNKATTACYDCGQVMKLKPCRSGAGWYAGFTCPRCGSPHDRVSGYFKTDDEAQAWIDKHGLPVKSY